MEDVSEKEILVNSLAELPIAAKRLLQHIGSANILTFEGEIGAGKTTFIKTICEQLGVENEVTSPTYSLVNEYRYSDPSSSNSGLIYHLDLYRLKSSEEAINIGIEDYLYSNEYCFIEWPTIIDYLLPEDAIRIKIKIISDSSRKVLFL